MTPNKPGWYLAEYRGERWMAAVYRADGRHWAAMLHPEVPDYCSKAAYDTTDEMHGGHPVRFLGRFVLTPTRRQPLS